jgi:predicted ester cyclase
MGVAPTGNTVSAAGIGMIRVVDGKIVEFRVSPDGMTIMQQIGASPTAP